VNGSSMNEKAVKQKVYLPGLNALRFFAALCVVVTHLELIKMAMGYPHAWNHPVVFNLGGLGVYFFFVLSGYLITYLLLIEKQNSGKVSVPHFYARRVLRIWPLYFLLLVAGFAVLPHFSSLHISYLQESFEAHYWIQLLAYIFILPNLGYACFGAVPHIGHLWSIGVEEQFYLVWPWLVKKSNNLLRTMLCVAFVLLFIKAAMLWAVQAYPCPALFAMKKFLAMFKIESMMVGSLAAYFLFTNKSWLLKIVYHPVVHLLAWLLIPALIYFTPAVLQDGIHIVYSVLFAVIVLNVSSNKKSFMKLENKLFYRLGNLSYGIYMYHFMIIPPVLLLLAPAKQALHNDTIWNIALYSLTLFITLFVSYISFYSFEKFFLNLKANYSTLTSG
jgi:peptidoglycan/LPS O-acetylase OafA/YrhL